MTLCEALDLAYAFAAEGAESLDKLDDSLGLVAPAQKAEQVADVPNVALLAAIGGEIG